MNSSDSFNSTRPYHDPQSADSPSQTVSWQTAFFSLAAVALNTIIQNSGAVLQYPSPARIHMRVSPILCALDALLAVVKFLYLMLFGCGPRDAARHVWWDRFEDEPDKSGSGIDKLWFWNMVAFGLGALPQLIKIYAIRGIPGTQAVATMYFAPFVIMEAFRLCAGPEEITEPVSMPIITRAKKLYNDTVVWVTVPGEIGQVCTSACAYGISYALRFENAPLQAHVLFGLVDGAFLCPNTIWLCYSLEQRPRNFSSSSGSEDREQPGIQEHGITIVDPPSSLGNPSHSGRLSTAPGVLAIFLIPLADVVLLLSSIGTRVETRVIDIPMLAMSTVFGTVVIYGIFLSSILLIVWLLRRNDGLSKAAGLHGSSLATGIWIIGLPVGTLLSLFVYYSTVYNPEGTWRPAWTEKLG